MKWVWIFLFFFFSESLRGEAILVLKNDSSILNSEVKDPKLFYDSLQVKASRYRITRWLYGSMICSSKDTANPDIQSYGYYKIFKNKTIGSITIKSLDVFGPNFNDTARTANLWIEKAANKLHTKSNLYVIRKNLWIKEGQLLDADLLMDNERLLRSLPYLKDVRFLLKTRPFNDEVVDIMILTQDVFSFGISGKVGNIHNGTFGIYDKNILGIGHEFGTNLIAHTDQLPHIGFETFYAVNNIKGRFINFSARYANTYLNEEYYISVDRDFLRPQSVYAGGLTAMRSLRSNVTYFNNNVLSATPLSYVYLDGWYGRRLRVGINSNDNRFQMTLSCRIRHISFNDRPAPDNNNNQYFANSTMYLASLSFSQRSYIRDQLVYSYGIVEDIPRGYLNELVFGFDQNEYGARGYSHLFLSTGNLLKSKPYYLYTSIGTGGFFNRNGIEQGIVDFKIQFISQVFNVWNVKARQFIKLNYTLGINRFEIERLLLRNTNGIRGFGSRIGNGQQRLTLNVENVFFQKKSVLNFQSALFSFFDIGIVGPAEQSIFNQNYYAGIGFGLRIRNENLIFKTLQLRLAFYPNHPSDVSSFGFILDSVSKTRFYNFQPRGPEPLRFE
jgi:hypothetical protein